MCCRRLDSPASGFAKVLRFVGSNPGGCGQGAGLTPAETQVLLLHSQAEKLLISATSAAFVLRWFRADDGGQLQQKLSLKLKVPPFVSPETGIIIDPSCCSSASFSFSSRA